MTFDLKMWHALRVHICLVCFAFILGVLYWLFYRRIWINNYLGVMNSITEFSFCTHLTFDLILRFRCISRFGIHWYSCWHTSRNTISMDATFCSILSSEEFFHGMDCQLKLLQRNSSSISFKTKCIWLNMTGYTRCFGCRYSIFDHFGSCFRYGILSLFSTLTFVFFGFW